MPLARRTIADQEVLALIAPHGKGSYTNDVTALGGEGVSRWKGVSKIIQNCVTSFMDDP